MRRRDTVLLGLSVVVSFAGCSPTGDARTADVVSIEATACDRPQPRHGVGTMVADRLALAAAHVVEGNLRELLVDGSPATVVGLDVEADLALLALDGPLDAAPRWTVATTDDIRPGSVRIMTGDETIETQLTRTLTLRVEDVSAGTTSERAALELGVVVEPGHSGSPVVDADGTLLGVVVLSRPGTDVSYASRIPTLDDLLEMGTYQELRARHAAAEAPSSLAPPVVCT